MSSFVYFIRPIGMDGPVKIGCSFDPEMRLDTFTTWSPFPLEICLKIPGDYDTEKHIHNHLAADHTHREWFRVSAQLLDLISGLKAGIALDALIDTTQDASTLRRMRYAGRAQRPEWFRRRVSYRHRIRHAITKLRTPSGYHDVPDDCERILASWSDDNLPSADDCARLEEVLADPPAHFKLHKFSIAA